MHLLIILRYWLDIRVPSLFFPCLPDSLLLGHLGERNLSSVVEASSESLVGSILEGSGGVAHPHASSSGRLNDVLPLDVWGSQERNRVRKLLSSLNFVVYFVFVGYVMIQDEGSSVYGGLECALSGSHGGPEFGSVLHAHRLHSLSGHGLGGGVLPEEF